MLHAHSHEATSAVKLAWAHAWGVTPTRLVAAAWLRTKDRDLADLVLLGAITLVDAIRILDQLNGTHHEEVRA